MRKRSFLTRFPKYQNVRPNVIVTGSLSSGFSGTGSATFSRGGSVARVPDNNNTIQTTAADGWAVPYARFDAPNWYGTAADGSLLTGVTAKTLYGTVFYDDDTYGRLGGLHEPASTNIVLYSEDQASWDNSWNGGVTITSDAAVAPDGQTTADKLTQIDGIGDANNQTLTLAASTAYTISGYFKNVDSGRSRIAVYDANASAILAEIKFIWTAGVPSTDSSSGASNITYEDVGSGWYRISYTFTTAATVTTHRSLIFPENSTAATNSIYVWGMQLNAGEFPGSYIKTTTATATRGATNLSIPVSGNIPVNNWSGIAVINPHTALQGSASNPVWIWGSYFDASNYVGIKYSGTDLEFVKAIAGVETVARIAYTPVAYTNATVGWKQDSSTGMHISLNGVEGTGSGATPGGIADMVLGTTLKIGTDGDDTSGFTGVISPFMTKNTVGGWHTWQP